MICPLPRSYFSRIIPGFVLPFFVSAFFILFPGFPVLGQNSNENTEAPASLEYQISRWYGFKQAAFTITFDDNYRYQFTYAAPLLNEHNYKATYFIVTNRVGKGYAPGWDTLRTLASQGHEIASHSKNHANFVTLSQNPQYADSMRREFRGSRDTINARIPSQQCETFAWPFGAVNVAALNVSKGYYMACRGSVNMFEGADPDNFYNIYSQHIYHDTPLETVNGYVDTIVSRQGWLVERWHGFRVLHDTCGYESVAMGEFREHLIHVAQKEGNLWIATLGKVVKYMRERDVSVLSLLDSSGYQVRFNLGNNLPDTLFHYNMPLSLKVRVYGKMNNVYMITQGSDTLSYGFTWYYGVKYIYFSAVPNHGNIILHISDPAGINDNHDPGQTAVNYPNPFKTTTTILFDLKESENIEIRVFDRTGQSVRDYSHVYPAGRNSLEFDGTGLSAGVYYCIIRTRERKMVVRLIMTN